MALLNHLTISAGTESERVDLAMPTSPVEQASNEQGWGDAIGRPANEPKSGPSVG